MYYAFMLTQFILISTQIKMFKLQSLLEIANVYKTLICLAILALNMKCMHQ